MYIITINIFKYRS